MNKFFVSRLLIALLFIVPVATFFIPSEGHLENERRQRASFPEIPGKLGIKEVAKFFRGIDTFVADHFPLRSSLLELSTTLYEVGGDNVNIDTCYRGKENWLFLGNKYARCVDKRTGRIVLSAANLKLGAERYKQIHDTVKTSGAEFFIFIGPNKSSIYPEYLPPIVPPAQASYIAPLVTFLNGAGVSVYDPTERLMAAKTSGILYFRTDSHWNALGAYEAFEGFREWAGLPALPPLSLTEGPLLKGDQVNSGGYKNFPLSTGDNYTLQWDVPPKLESKDGLTHNPHAVSDKTAWVFGDSFAGALSSYITAEFKGVRFLSHKDFESAMSSQLPKPDAVLWVVVERNFAPPY